VTRESPLKESPLIRESPVIRGSAVKGSPLKGTPLKERPVAVVVVGDLARSPRMLNHARELARTGRPVCLVGLREREFAAPAGASVAALRPWRSIGRLGLPGAALRMGLTFLQLVVVLLRLKPAVILVQNPPAFPTLLAAWIAARMRRVLLVVDWHNYGYTMLALQVGASHALTRLAAGHEGWMARRAARHFCVSKAMQADLARRFGVRAEVLYDRPAECFPQSFPAAGTPPRLIAVCPAGWTADEDMALLLDALELLSAREMEIHLTGDGPLRAALEPRIAALRAAGWAIHTGFLTEAEYRALLGRGHLGLSLHRSSSGLDLAMKVVDLFAAGVPVCALDYGGSLSEQVTEGETGFLFRSAAELAGLLARLQREPQLLGPMRERIRAAWNTTWTEEWRRAAQPAFEGGS
jgi:beta-1,4-mannosyltransferase